MNLSSIYMSPDSDLIRVSTTPDRDQTVWSNVVFWADGLRIGALVVLLLLCIEPRQLTCQFARQAALLSRPASVVLVARLETLSLAVVPAAEVNQLSSSSTRLVGNNISITSSWALPKNLTTLRVTVYSESSVATSLGGGTPLQKPPSPDFPANGSKETPLPLALTSTPVAAAKSGETVWLQGSGDSNLAASRTDKLHIVPNDIDPKHFNNEDSGTGTSLLTFVVQAL